MEHLPAIVLALLLAAFLVWLAFGRLRATLIERFGTSRWRDTYKRLGRVRTNRFKLTKKARLKERLCRDDEVRQAILDHADETGASLGEGERKVWTYLDEIIPAFDLVSYYQLGLPVAALAIGSLYKRQVWKEAVPEPKALHQEHACVYVFNHRSNADFVYASFELKDRVQLSYAVGEWARLWPLEKLFKSFGSYFVRRGYREALYHRVLRRYVQTITIHGVTQGIFLEGGLSRDGHFRPPKVGLLDALLQVTKEPGFDKDLIFVPGSINYDRVLEDRSLVAEAEGRKPDRSLWRMAKRTLGILFKNTLKLALRRVRKHGYAALRLGEPVSFHAWVAEHGDAALTGDREQRKPHVEAFAEHLMGRIKELMPVCAVPLCCLALERLDFAALPDDLHEEAEALRRILERAGARFVRGDKSPDEMVRYATLLLETRSVLQRDAAGTLRVAEEDRGLVRYYARSIAHLVPAGTPDRLVQQVM